MRAQTLRAAFERSGPGVHLGLPATVRVEPAPWGHGLRWLAGEGSATPVHADHARAEPGSTVLVGAGAEVRTPEHLLAALVGCGLTDALIRVSGPEVPVLDGSAGQWCDAIEESGVLQGPEASAIDLAGPVRVEAHGGLGEAWPAGQGRAEVEVDFGPGGPAGFASVLLDGRQFAVTTARARTFVLERDVQRLRDAGRGRGATEENTVVWRADGPTAGLRRPDEPIRHKLVDLVGDLALLGRPMRARVRVLRGSHGLHHALVRAMLDAAAR